jgi:SAM-dependent methyltransferase
MRREALLDLGQVGLGIGESSNPASVEHSRPTGLGAAPHACAWTTSPYQRGQRLARLVFLAEARRGGSRKTLCGALWFGSSVGLAAGCGVGRLHKESQMDRYKVPSFERAIRAVACTNCQSATKLELQDDQIRCRDCDATYKIIDGVLDLMPPSYSGYQGDSEEAATLRDAHDRQALREETVRLRSAFDQLLQPEALVLDAGCGTGHLARIISESQPDVTIIATDVSLPMCRLAAKNCRGRPVMVVHTPTSKIPPMPFRNSVFDIVLNRLAPMDPAESFRLLRSSGYAVNAELVDAHWQEIRHVFGQDRLITFPRDLEPKGALFKAGFSEAESHSWRFTKTRSLKEIIMVLRYAPILRDFDETADRPLLSKLEDLYGDQDGIRVTEGESLVIGQKDGFTRVC